MTNKQIKYIANRSAGKNKRTSAIDAGYGNSSPNIIESSNGMKETLKIALETVGVDSQYMANHLKGGLTIRKQSFTSSKEIRDNDVQQRYAQLVMRARGDIDGETQNTVNLGIIQIPGMSDSIETWNGEKDSSQ